MFVHIKKILLNLTILCLFFNIVILIVGVFSRHVFNSSPIWVDEAMRYILIGSVMLMSGVLINTNEHMRISILDKFTKSNLSFTISLYRHLMTIFVSIFIMYSSFRYATSITSFNTIGLGVSKSIPLYLLPIGFFLSLCFLLLN
ncbi:TRAP transporter small permease subunit [Vibrio tetraodonis]|uniref:TRAP transporter small permease n=1 Tax=Vibrio tetraodonis TaxID=2231647 RepID=UPI000E0A0E18